MLRLTPLFLIFLGLPASAQLEPGQPAVVPDGERLPPLPGVQLTTTLGEPIDLAFARDGSGVFALHADGRLSASRADDSHPGWTHDAVDPHPFGLLTFDDGSLLVANQKGRIQRIQGDGTLTTLREASPTAIQAFAGDESSVALALADGSLEIWRRNRENDRESAAFQPLGSPHDSLVHALSVASGRIAVGYEDGRVALFNIEEEPNGSTDQKSSPARLILFEAPVQALTWAPESDALYVLTGDGRLHELDGDKQRTWSAPFEASGMRATADGSELILFAPSAGRIAFWDRMRGQLRAEERIQPAPEASRRAFALSPVDSTFVTASGPHLRWRRFHPDEPRFRNRMSEGQASALSAGALSENGLRIAVATGDGDIGLWDTRTGSPAGFRFGTSEVTALAFAPGDDSLVAARASGAVELHSLPEGGTSFLRDPSLTIARDLVFLPSGELLAADSDGRLRFVGSEAEPIDAHEGPCNSLTLASDGTGATVLASGGDDGKVSLFLRAVDGRLQRSATFDEEAPVEDVLLRADASEVLSANADGTLRLRRIADGEVLRTFELGSPPRAMALFAGEELLLVLLADGAVLRLSLTEELAPVPLVRPSAPGVWLDAALGARFFVRATQDGVVQLIEQETGRIVRRFPGDAGTVRVIATGTLGRFVAAASTDGWIRVWDLEEKRLTALIEGHGGSATALALRADGKRLLTGGLDGELRIWEFPELRPRRIIHFSAEPVQALEFLLEGSEGLVLAADGTVRRFELDGAATAMMARKVFARIAVFAPDGERMASAEENLLCVRRATALNGEVLQEWRVEHPITALDWSGDGEWIVAGDEAGALVLFRPGDEKPRRLGSQPGPITSALFSPGSDHVASLGVGSAVGIWNVEGANSAGFLAGHDGATTALAFLGDGRRLVTGGPAGRLRVWDLEERRLETELTSWDGPCWTLQERDGRLWHGSNGTIVERYRDGAWAVHPLPPSEEVELTIETVPLRSDVNPRFGLVVTNSGSHPVHGLWVGGSEPKSLAPIGPWIHTRLEPGESAQLLVYVWPTAEGTWPNVLLHHSGGSVEVDLPDDAFER